MRKGRPAISLLFSPQFRFHPSCRNLPAKAFGSPAKFPDATPKQSFLRPQHHSAHLTVSEHTDGLSASHVRPASSADNRRSQKASSEPRRRRSPQDCVFYKYGCFPVCSLTNDQFLCHLNTEVSHVDFVSLTRTQPEYPLSDKPHLP